jgi:hypothetical protein
LEGVTEVVVEEVVRLLAIGGESLPRCRLIQSLPVALVLAFGRRLVILLILLLRAVGLLVSGVDLLSILIKDCLDNLLVFGDRPILVQDGVSQVVEVVARLLDIGVV